MKRLGLSILVFLITLLVCVFLGDVLAAQANATLKSIGEFFGSFSGLIGVIAGLWYFFASPSPKV